MTRLSFVGALYAVIIIKYQAVDTKGLKISTRSSQRYTLTDSSVDVFCTYSPTTNRETFSRLTWSKESGEVILELRCDGPRTCENTTHKGRHSLIVDHHFSGNLTIRSLTQSDSGTYTCEVVTLDGVSKRATTLSVHGIELPDGLELSAIGKLVSGTPRNINCTAAYGYPVPAIHWFVGSRDITPSASLHTKTNPNGLLNATSELVYTPSKTHHGQHLICKAIMAGEVMITSYRLDVLYVPVIVDLSRYYGKQLSIRITCIADANPAAEEFEWFLEGEMLANTSSRVRTQQDRRENPTRSSTSFLISDVDDTEYGVYECRAGNILGLSVPATVNVTFIVHGSGEQSTTLSTVHDWDLTEHRNRFEQLNIISGGLISTALLVCGLFTAFTILYKRGCHCKFMQGNSIKDRESETTPVDNGRTVDDDGLVYISVSADRDHAPRAPPIRTERRTD